MIWLILQKKTQDLRHTFLILVLVFQFIHGWALPSGPEKKYAVIHDFKHDWLEYDGDEKQFIPQIKENNPNNRVHSLIINLSEYHGAFILLKVESKDEYLFIDKTLYKKIPENQWLILSNSRLRELAKKEIVVLSFFGDPNLDTKQVIAGYPLDHILGKGTKSVQNSILNFFPRNFSSYQSGMVLIFVLCILIISFLANNYVKAFKKFYDFRDMLSTSKKAKSFILNKPLDRPNLLFVILLSVISTFILIILQSRGVEFLKDSWFFKEGNSFGTLISNFFKISILIFLLFVLKYFFINTTAALFNISKTVDLHYFKVIQSTLIAFSAMLILLLIAQNLYFDLGTNLKEFVMLILLIFYLTRTLIVYFTLNRAENINFLYLFSYLCIVEILPILIGFRMTN